MTEDATSERAADSLGQARNVESLYAEWQLPVQRFVHRLTGDQQLAEDVTHEAFLRLMRTSIEIRSPGSWLFRTALNLVRDAARRHETHDRRTASWQFDPPEQPDERLDRTEAVRAVRAALDRLAPRDREVLMMREAGFSYEEIATAFDVQPQTVPPMVMRALRRFRASYETGES